MPLDSGPYFYRRLHSATPVEPATGTGPIAIHTDFRSLSSPTRPPPAIPGGVHTSISREGRREPFFSHGSCHSGQPAIEKLLPPYQRWLARRRYAGSQSNSTFFGLAPRAPSVCWQMDVLRGDIPPFHPTRTMFIPGGLRLSTLQRTHSGNRWGSTAKIPVQNSCSDRGATRSAKLPSNSKSPSRSFFENKRMSS